MKHLVLAFSLLLAAPSAWAGGIYTNTTGSVATGTANVPATLWSQSLAGGAISANDAMIVHVVVSSSANSSFEVKLHGQTLFWSSMTAGEVLEIDLRVTRTGTTIGAVSGLATYSGVGSPYWIDFGAVTGLQWTSSQVFSVVGESDQVGGLILQTGGIQR